VSYLYVSTTAFLRTLSGCVGAPCTNLLTSYQRLVDKLLLNIATDLLQFDAIILQKGCE
jgi:hypothetical protein